MKHKVNIIEREIGWGARIDEVKDFDTYKEARKYCVDYNVKYNMEEHPPSWYMYAALANPIAGDEGLLRE